MNRSFLITAMAAGCACALAITAQTGGTGGVPKGVQKIEIAVERKHGTRVERMDPAFVFDTGDLVRFRFRLSFNGYLYVVNQSSSGKFAQLFPKDETGLDNRVEHDREYVLPASDTGWFRVQDPAGYEMVYWIVSPSKLPDHSPASLTSPAIPRPDQLSPRCDDTIFKARGECLDVTAGPKAVTDISSLPADMLGGANIQPRDMDMVKSNKAITVMGQSDGDAPFIYVFRLAHRAVKK